jgi:hypothetical protein
MFGIYNSFYGVSIKSVIGLIGVIPENAGVYYV